MSISYISDPVITVGTKTISKDSPTFIVAEIACNHICDLDRARKMIDVAYEAGADAIKFQTYKADHLVTQNATSYWKYGPSAVSQYEYYKKLDRFDKKEYELLFSYSKNKGLIAFSTPFDVNSAYMLNDLGVEVFKIASCDVVDVRLLRCVARFQKPVIISTGAAELVEIQKGLEAVFSSGNSKVVLLACTMSYPAKDEDAHLQRIRSLGDLFPGIHIGYSDHTSPDVHMVIPSIAVSLGAKVIEKHFTLDRTMTGSGHAFSTDPESLRKMIHNIRLTEKVIGQGTIGVYEIEKEAREKARRSLVAERDICRGEKITSEMIGIKRPGTGLPAYYIDEIVGKIARKDIRRDEQITLTDIGESTL